MKAVDDQPFNYINSVSQYLEAIELCHRHNVIMTEELCEKLTPGKPADDAEVRLRAVFQTESVSVEAWTKSVERTNVEGTLPLLRKITRFTSHE